MNTLNRKTPLRILPILTCLCVIMAHAGCSSSSDNSLASKPSATESGDDSSSDTEADKQTAAEDETKASEKPVRTYSMGAFRNAAMQGKLEIVESVIASGADVNDADLDGRTALHLASFEGKTAVVQRLLKAGADIQQKDMSGRTAIMFASTGPFADTVKLLLDSGAVVNERDTTADGFTALMFAAGEGQLEVVKLLLEAGADLTLRDTKDGDSARDFAVEKNHVHVVAALDKAAKAAPDSDAKNSDSTESSEEKAP